jgi:hypothetical protein
MFLFGLIHGFLMRSSMSHGNRCCSTSSNLSLNTRCLSTNKFLNMTPETLYMNQGSSLNMKSIPNYRPVMTKESSPMMMTHTDNTRSLRCQDLGRRTGVEEVVVRCPYSVVLVWLVWFVSKRFVNEIKGLDYQSNISKILIIKGLDNQDQVSKYVCLTIKHLILKPRTQ